jgi:hypothetical protein
MSCNVFDKRTKKKGVLSVWAWGWPTLFPSLSKCW